MLRRIDSRRRLLLVSCGAAVALAIILIFFTPGSTRQWVYALAITAGIPSIAAFSEWLDGRREG